MIQNIKELQNAQLQQQVKAAASMAEAIKLITTVGAEKGYSFFHPECSSGAQWANARGARTLKLTLPAVAGGARGSAITGLSRPLLVKLAPGGVMRLWFSNCQARL